jgi:hypothetical protein
LRVDDAIETSLLQVVEPGAIVAAVAADTEASQRRNQIREALMRDLEAARSAADRAFRQYDAADPANRLVASELETRWNSALARVTEVEGVDRRPCGILHHEQTAFELYSNFNNIRVRSFILNGAPLAYKTANVWTRVFLASDHLFQGRLVVHRNRESVPDAKSGSFRK